MLFWKLTAVAAFRLKIRKGCLVQDAIRRGNNVTLINR